jgi:undecaprenyl phosphate-alpha-L-ara4FN deformylase
VAAEGHEVAPHGHDHFGWQAGVDRWSAARVRADLRSAAAAYARVFGVRPGASAAPGWRMTAEALAIQEEHAFVYASDVRGVRPFVALGPRGPLATLQVPTTLPTADEVLGRVRDVAGALESALVAGLNVFTLHAEVEGGPLLGVFADFLTRCRRRGVAFARLADLAGDLREEAAARPVSRVVRGLVPGRSGWVAVQEPA